MKYVQFIKNYCSMGGGVVFPLNCKMYQNFKTKISCFWRLTLPHRRNEMISQVMLILMLIDVLYSQKVFFNFEKCSNGKNHSSSGSHHLVKKFSTNKISDSFPLPLPPTVGNLSPSLTAIWKTLVIWAFIFLCLHEPSNLLNCISTLYYSFW